VKKAKTTSEPELPQEDEVVVFEYIKSQLFRVIHSDGAIGGITPTGNVHVAFYSDRAAIPKVQGSQKKSRWHSRRSAQKAHSREAGHRSGNGRGRYSKSSCGRSFDALA
jgi:hypothetical protein